MKEGNIVEQGSPSELLCAGGEFTKIWENGSELRSDDQILDKKPTKDDNQTPDQPDELSLNRHIKEGSGSTFRPDAPEFVPHVQTTKESSNRAHGTPSNVRPGHHHDSRDTLTHAQSHGASAKRRSGSPPKRMNNKACKKSANLPRKSDMSAETDVVKTQPDTPSSQLDGSTALTSTNGKTGPRLSRWQRRRQARSDPNSSAVGPDHPESSETKLRHVSGPGKIFISVYEFPCLGRQ